MPPFACVIFGRMGALTLVGCMRYTVDVALHNARREPTMEKLKRFWWHTPAALAVGLCAFFNPFLFFLSTDFHGCFADVVPGCDIVIRVVQWLCAIGILGLLFVFNLGKGQALCNNKAVVVAYTVAAIFTWLLTVANIVILLLLSSSIPMARYYFEIAAPYLLGFGVVLSLCFVVPRLGNKTKIAIVVAIYALCGLMIVAVDLWHCEPFDFCTTPVVFDTGDGYSVVWSTTDISTGYVSYTYRGQQYEVADSQYGRMVSNRTIHHANIPYQHLDGNTYTVHATRMLDNAPYFARRGKTISTTRTFAGRPTQDIHMVAITDNHCLSRAKFGKVRQDDYNCVLMLGDFSDFVHQELDIADFLLYPAAYLSDGTIPVLYAKGNHDTHSEMGADLAYLLGYDSFYYRVTYGEYTFTVLDSGSCNVDLEEEKYAGVGRYIAYRQQQLDWFEALPAAAGYEIAVVHVWDYASVAEGVSDDRARNQAARYAACVKAKSIDFQLSGHKHDLCFFPDGVNGVEVPMLRCGGISAGLIGHSLIYSVLSMQDGKITMTGYNTRSATPVWSDSYTMTK